MVLLSPTTTVTSAWETRTPTGKQDKQRSWCPALTADVLVSPHLLFIDGLRENLRFCICLSTNRYHKWSNSYIIPPEDLVVKSECHMSDFSRTARRRTKNVPIHFSAKSDMKVLIQLI